MISGEESKNRGHFFSQRIVNSWNKLTMDVRRKNVKSFTVKFAVKSSPQNVEAGNNTEDEIWRTTVQVDMWDLVRYNTEISARSPEGF